MAVIPSETRNLINESPTTKVYLVTPENGRPYIRKEKQHPNSPDSNHSKPHKEKSKVDDLEEELLTRHKDIDKSFRNEIGVYGIKDIHNSPYIVTMLTHGENEEFITFEYCSEGSLRNFLKQHGQSIPTLQRWRIALDILEGLRLLHSLGIVHSNLTLDNIFIYYDVNSSCYRAKIGGLGYAHFLGHSDNVEEIFCNPTCPHTLNKKKAGDVFAFGVNVLAMVQEVNLPARLWLINTKDPKDKYYRVEYENSHAEEIKGEEDYISTMNPAMAGIEEEYDTLIKRCFSVFEKPFSLEQLNPEFQQLKTAMEEQYINGRKSIGDGAFAKVFLLPFSKPLSVIKVFKTRYIEVWDKEGNCYKEIESGEKEESFALERYVLEKMFSPNIVQLYNADPHNLSLTLEYCNQGDLCDYVLSNKGDLVDLFLWNIANDIASALYLLHSHNIFHRDLNPRNILLHLNPEESIPRGKLADFGLAHVQEENYKNKLSEAILPYHCMYHVSKVPKAADDIYAFHLILLFMKIKSLMLVEKKEILPDGRCQLIYRDGYVNTLTISEGDDYIAKDNPTDKLEKGHYKALIESCRNPEEKRPNAKKVKLYIEKSIDTFFGKDKDQKVDFHRKHLLPCLETFYSVFSKIPENDVSILSIIITICKNPSINSLEKFKMIFNHIEQYQGNMFLILKNSRRTPEEKEAREKLKPIFMTIKKLYTNRNFENLRAFEEAFLAYKNSLVSQKGKQKVFITK